MAMVFKRPWTTAFVPSPRISRAPPRCPTRLVACRGASKESDYSDIIRTSPVLIGIASFGFTVANRAVSGVPPVADASSSQSRADVLVLALSATVLLTGLVWISIRPRRSKAVELVGVDCMRVSTCLTKEVQQELYWAWEALQRTTCAKSMVIVYKHSCVLQAGLAAESSDSPGQASSVDAPALLQGPLCSGILASGKLSYLANLKLYPGRFELAFLPSNTQAVIIQPLSDCGVLILGGDTIRGFSVSDQKWISTLGDKLEVSLEDNAMKLGGKEAECNG